MTEQLFVPTDARGVERIAGRETVWPLPSAGSPGEPFRGGPVLLLTLDGLVDELGDRIFLAEPLDEVPTPAGPGTVETGAARLLAETPWSVALAARFALDCAGHVLGDAAEAELPGGLRLGEVVEEARTVLDRSSEPVERRLGALAHLSAARRLRRRSDLLGDVAFEAVDADAGALDALDDPAWATLAAARDAVLAAVEALRHLAFPRYVSARERAYEDVAFEGDDSPPVSSGMIATPWGPITLGAEHRSGFAPAWMAARDAAGRARDAARDRGGDEASGLERAWQIGRLEELLEPGDRPAS